MKKYERKKKKACNDILTVTTRAQSNAKWKIIKIYQALIKCTRTSKVAQIEAETSGGYSIVKYIPAEPT